MFTGIFKRKKTQKETPSPLDIQQICNFWGIPVEEAKPLGKCYSLEEAGKKLLMTGAISEETYLAGISNLHGIPYALLEEEEISPVSLQIDPYILRSKKFVPFRETDGEIHVATANPRDLYALEYLYRVTGKKLSLFVSTEERVESAINKLFGKQKQETDTDLEIDDSNIETLIDLASEAPVIRLVNMIISRAVENNASDIHIEPFEKEVKVRYRIDGVLREVDSLPKKLLPAVTSRIKIMARLDIANRRTPQDGRTKIKVGGREVDIRVATLPTIYGEQVVMRLLDKEKSEWDVDRIGLSPEEKDLFLNLISASHGMILVTGPTGSGKTTTLYSALKVLNKEEVKIITIEDPVEYVIPGIIQIQVNPQAGLTFASGLRSIVRQDPDIIMVGEIRDKETADIAIHAALTGHLVLSTLHTNDAPSAITRLTDMGIDSFLVASSVIGIVAQRLVRVICPNCREEVTLPEDVKKRFNFSGPAFRGKGCEICKYSGYTGRTAIYEILIVDDDIRKAVTSSADSESIKKIAVSKGMKTLMESGLEKVRKGITTLEEVMRVAYRV